MTEVGLSNYKDGRVERLGLHVTLDDGSRISLDPIDMWADGKIDAYREVVADDKEAAVRALIGDEQTERLLADPKGDPRLYLMIVDDWAGGKLPES